MECPFGQCYCLNEITEPPNQASAQVARRANLGDQFCVTYHLRSTGPEPSKCIHWVWMVFELETCRKMWFLYSHSSLNRIWLITLRCVI